MKLQMMSVKDLANITRDTAIRFPPLAFFLCVGAANHLYQNIYEVETFKYISRNIFMILLVLLPVLHSVRILYESSWIGKRTRLVLETVSVIGSFLYFYYLPNQPLILFYWSQFTILFIGSLLLCVICFKEGTLDDSIYWDLLAILFIRLVVTGLFTSIIVGGTSAALGAIDSLFKTDLFRHYETRILIVTLWIFAPIFFLSGVPNPAGSEKVSDLKPKWLRNIGVYIMVPLTTLYLGILYAYGGKILFQWQLPEGLVSYLILSFAAFGIISLLIIFPFQKDKNSKWCYRFSRYFFFLLFEINCLFDHLSGREDHSGMHFYSVAVDFLIREK